MKLRRKIERALAPMRERLLWPIADWSDKHDRLACWSDLVSWVMFDGYTLRDARNGGGKCVQDAARDGSCYCGRFKAVK